MKHRRTKQKRHFVTGPFAAGFFQVRDLQQQLTANKLGNGQLISNTPLGNVDNKATNVTRRTEDKAEQTDNIVEVETELVNNGVQTDNMDLHEVIIALDICNGDYQTEIENYGTTVEDKEVFNFEPDFPDTVIDIQHEAGTSKSQTQSEIKTMESVRISTEQNQEKFAVEFKDINMSNVESNQESKTDNRIMCSLCRVLPIDEEKPCDKPKIQLFRQTQSAPAIHTDDEDDVESEILDSTNIDKTENKPNSIFHKTSSTMIKNITSLEKPLKMQVRSAQPLKKNVSPRSAFLYWKYVEANCGLADGIDVSNFRAENELNGESEESLKVQVITEFDKGGTDVTRISSVLDNQDSNQELPESLSKLAVRSWQDEYASEAASNDQIPDNDPLLMVGACAMLACDRNETMEPESNTILKPEERNVKLNVNVTESVNVLNNQEKNGRNNEFNKFDIMFADVIHELDALDEKIVGIQESCGPRSLSTLSSVAAATVNSDNSGTIEPAACKSATATIQHTQVTYL